MQERFRSDQAHGTRAQTALRAQAMQEHQATLLQQIEEKRLRKVALASANPIIPHLEHIQIMAI